MSKAKRIVAAILATVMVLTLLSGCKSSKENSTSSTKGSAESTQTKNEKPYAGTTIRFVGTNNVLTEIAKEKFNEFTEKTGIKVEFEGYTDTQASQKISIEFTSRSKNIDVIIMRPLNETKLFVKNGWLAPLDEYFTDDKEYDFGDFSKESVSVATSEGKTYGIPIMTERQILYYRKDLFEQKGLQAPKTLDDMLEAAKVFNDPQKEMYGCVLRGLGNSAVVTFSSFLRSMGGDFVVDGKAAINTPEAIKAFQVYGDLLGEYGPPGAMNMTWMQAGTLFQQGKAAMWAEPDSIYAMLTDPKQSTVSDKVGYAVFPAGPNGSKPYNVTPMALSISASSANKEAAWEFIKWFTSKEMVQYMQSKGNPGARDSVWNSTEGTQNFPKELAEVINQSIKIGVSTDRPVQVLNVAKSRDIIGLVISEAISGGDVKAAADKANKELQDLIDSEAGK